jgi:hypothetical protein
MEVQKLQNLPRQKDRVTLKTKFHPPKDNSVSSNFDRSAKSSY